MKCTGTNDIRYMLVERHRVVSVKRYSEQSCSAVLVFTRSGGLCCAGKKAGFVLIDLAGVAIPVRDSGGCSESSSNSYDMF